MILSILYLDYYFRDMNTQYIISPGWCVFAIGIIFWEIFSDVFNFIFGIKGK